jgi:hypothetical protein
MGYSMQRSTLALGLAGALALGAVVPASAAPVLSAGASLKMVSAANVTDVRWRGYWGGAGIGFAAGAIIGAAAASAYYGGGYYGGPYYGAGPYVYDAPGPVYVVPAYPYGYYGYGGRCGRERYWDPRPSSCW